MDKENKHDVNAGAQKRKMSTVKKGDAGQEQTSTVFLVRGTLLIAFSMRNNVALFLSVFISLQLDPLIIRKMLNIRSDKQC